MRESGIDISGNQTKAASGYIKSGGQFAYVITVCDENERGTLSDLPGRSQTPALGFPRPLELSGCAGRKTFPDPRSA